MELKEAILASISRDIFPAVIDYYTSFKFKQNKPEYYETSWDNERFYQYLCLKALNRDFPHVIKADKEYDRKQVDIQMILNGIPEIIIEMKRYYSKDGNEEIDSFKSDLEWLSRFKTKLNLFIITTIHQTIQRNENRKYLSDKLNIPEDLFSSTNIPLDDKLTFEIYGIEIKNG